MESMPPRFSVERIRRFVAHFLLFVLVPLGLIFLLGLHAVDLEEAAAGQRARDRFEQQAAVLCRDFVPTVYVQERFSRLADRLALRPPTALAENRLVPLLNRIRHQWPFEFDPYVFDERGKLVTPMAVAVRSRYVAERVWELIHTPPDRVADVFRQRRKQILTFFGWGFRLFPLISQPGTVQSIHVQGRPGYAFWQSFSPGRAGVLFVAWEIPSEERIMRRLIPSRLPPQWQIIMGSVPAAGKSFDPASATLFHRSDRQNRPMAESAATLDSELLKSLEQSFRWLDLPWVWLSPHLWIRSRIGPVELWIGQAAPAIEFGRVRQAVQWGVGFFFAVLSGLFLHALFRPVDVSWSIRQRLVALFLYAVLLPALGMVFLGIQVMRDRSQALAIRSHRQARNILQQIDQEFGSRGGRNLPLFQERFRSMVPLTDSRKWPAVFDDLLRSRRIMRYEIRDLAGRLMVSSQDGAAFEGMEGILEAFAMSCIDRHLQPRRSREAPGQTLQIDPTIQTIIESPEMGFSYVIDRPDQVCLLRFGDDPMFLYWNYIGEPGHPAAYFCIFESVHASVEQYLRQRLLDIRERESWHPFALVARHGIHPIWYPDLTGRTRQNRGGKRVGPQSGRPDRVAGSDLDILFERLRQHARPLDTQIRWAGRRYLATGMTGVHLAPFSLVALFPEPLLATQVETIRRFLAWGVLLTILVAAFAGWSLAGTFLEPIGQLTQGVSAISRKDTAFRTDIRQHDELGDLGRTFNAMIEDLKEMELARAVQEALIPRSVPPIPGVAGRSRQYSRRRSRGRSGRRVALLRRALVGGDRRCDWPRHQFGSRHGDDQSPPVRRVARPGRSGRAANPSQLHPDQGVSPSSP
jgi:HAMP domain-containing protein